MSWLMNISEHLEDITGIPSQYINLIIVSIIIILIVKFIRKIIYEIYLKFHEQSREIYLYNRKTQLLSNIIILLLLIIVWGENIKSFMTFISFFSAGVVIAIREIVLNFVAGLYIKINKPFSLEDRIEINGLKGDVVNLNLTSFDILEIGDRVKGEQSTGRIVHVPNSIVFAYPLKNYVKAFKYIWNEITVVIDLDSDVQKVKYMLYKIVKKNSVIKEIPKKMENQISTASEDYRIYFNNLQPIIYTSVVDGHIELYIRYLVHPKKARNVEDLIWIDILKLNREKKIKLIKSA
ncbi:MAG: mechanosensitive ion channel [Clostridia bacterium]|nr:mechanosensitive ion channel [Clostridia bacterium]